MKRIFALFMIVISLFSVLGVGACQNNAGDVDDGGKPTECQHVVGADGVCALCQKDILATWRTIFAELKNYKGFSEKDYTMITTLYNGEIKMATQIVKGEKNKIYIKVVDETIKDEEKNPNMSMGISGMGVVGEEYLENIPEEKIIMSYYSKYGERWSKAPIETVSYDYALANLELVYSPYGRLQGFEKMVPDKIEYREGKYFITYSAYEGKAVYVITVENNYVTKIDIKQSIGGMDGAMIIEINYDDVNITLPNAELREK